MVCLPLRRMTNSSTAAVNSASVSRSAGPRSTSTIIGIMTCGPAFADERERAVEVEEHEAELAAREGWVEDFDFVVEEHG